MGDKSSHYTTFALGFSGSGQVLSRDMSFKQFSVTMIEFLKQVTQKTSYRDIFVKVYGNL
jgi:hypothetical protein